MTDWMDTIRLWFQSPEWLWALSGLAIVVALDMWRGLWRSWVGRGAMLARLMVLAGLILAMASPVLEISEPASEVIFVVDISESVDNSALQESLKKIARWKDALPDEVSSGLVTFDDDAQVVAYPSKSWELPARLRDEDAVHMARGTDLEEGVSTALGLLREGSKGRIVVMSDGRLTRGKVDGVLAIARHKGVSVDVVELAASRSGVVFSELDVSPKEVLAGESIEANMKFWGGAEEQSAKLVMEVDGEVAIEQEVVLRRDEVNEVMLKHSLKADIKPGKHEVKVYLEGSKDVSTESKTTSLVVREAANILIVTSKMAEVEPLARVLKAEGLNPVVMLTEELYRDDAPSLEDVDLVVLGNVPARMKVLPAGIVPMPDRFISDLRSYISQGGGLVVLGGNLAYDLGNYGGSELRKVLPVELEPEDSEIHQPVTMVIILDRSGSMGQIVGGVTKMDLTNRGAVAAMKLLRPYDNIGVMSVDERVHWNVPVQPARVTSKMTRQVRAIYADGGGIFCYTALVEAWDALKKVDTPLKHVILFSDAMDAEEQVQGIMIGWGPGPNSYELAQNMVKDGITVSVIGVGSKFDVDSPFLSNLARHGKGRFHISTNARRLESLFVEETTQLLQLRLKEKNFRPAARKKHVSLKGVELKKAPKLRGYVKLEAKPSAEVVMVGPEEHPMMVTWQYGLGQVTAMATDAGPRWSGNWLDWEGYSTFWTQLARWSLKRSEGQGTGVQVEVREGEVVLDVVRRTGLNRSQDAQHLRGMLREAGTQAWRDVEVRVVEPGHFEVRPDVLAGHAYEFGVLDNEGNALLTQSFTTPLAEELKYATPDATLLAHMAERGGGQVLSGEFVWPKGEGSFGERYREHVLWLWLAMGALVMLVFDAFLRRGLRTV